MMAVSYSSVRVNQILWFNFFAIDFLQSVHPPTDITAQCTVGSTLEIATSRSSYQQITVLFL